MATSGETQMLQLTVRGLGGQILGEEFDPICGRRAVNEFSLRPR